MIGDLKREFRDGGGLGMKVEKDPLQVGDMRNSILYTFGKNTIEVDMPKDAGSFPFDRVTKDNS